MKKFLLIATMFFVSVFSQEKLDKIIAVVDNEIILKSELDIRTMFLAAQRNIAQDDTTFKKQVLEDLIGEKLIYAQAQLDSIAVSDEEVNMELENKINMFLQQYGSKETLEKAFGMTIEKIKREFKEETKKELMRKRMTEKKFGRIEASVRETQDFYTQYSDSLLGIIPERFKISHIFINPKTNDRIKLKAREFAQSILDSLKKGADFTELAKAVSDDVGSAADGGNLGWAKRGVFFPEFEAAAFALRENQMSDLVESKLGYHIIQLLGRRGESINSRHILIKFKSDDQTEIEAIQLLSDIRDSIKQNVNSFAYYAKKYSDDKQTSMFGGNLGDFEISQLDEAIKDVVFKLKEKEISAPKRLQIDRGTVGYHIVYLEKRTPEHKPTLEGDFETIKNVASYQKKQNAYKAWLEELKSNIFWEIKE